MLEEKECGGLEQGGKREERRLIWDLGSEKGLDRWDLKDWRTVGLRAWKKTRWLRAEGLV